LTEDLQHQLDELDRYIAQLSNVSRDPGQWETAVFLFHVAVSSVLNFYPKYIFSVFMTVFKALNTFRTPHVVTELRCISELFAFGEILFVLRVFRIAIYK